MKILITICLTLIFSLPFAQAQETDQSGKVIVGNNTNIDFSSLDTSTNKIDFSIQVASIEKMIKGDITVLISNTKWTDLQMADYQQRYASNPHQLVIGAFDKDINKQSDTDKTKTNESLKSKLQLAEVFSTRDGSKLLYLYISELEGQNIAQNIAEFFSVDAQKWLKEQGIIPIPEPVLQQNLVTLKLKEAKFEGGYK